MKIVRVNFLNEFCMAIQNFRVSVDHQYQQKNFYLRCRELKFGSNRERESLSSQPIKYFFSLEGTFSSAREHLSNQAHQMALIQVSVQRRGSGNKTIKVYIILVSQQIRLP